MDNQLPFHLKQSLQFKILKTWKCFYDIWMDEQCVVHYYIEIKRKIDKTFFSLWIKLQSRIQSFILKLKKPFGSSLHILISLWSLYLACYFDIVGFVYSFFFNFELFLDKRLLLETHVQHTRMCNSYTIGTC